MKLTIGEKIAVLRKEKNISQTELAEYLFLSQQTVSQWEVGNVAPEITLLPKIATFFGVSIDELFGMTSIERAEDLVSKYSVLRDDRSFQEAMECVNLQLQTIDASLKNITEDATELKKNRDILEAEKIHLWIQQGWESLQRALKMVDSFVKRTEQNPEHPWYLRMRLQKNQLRMNLGEGREALTECKRNFAENPDENTLLIYFCMLSELHNYEEILTIQETESRAREIIFPVSEKNLGIWWQLIQAAAKTSEMNFVEKNMPSILEVCSEEDEFEFLMCLLDLYQEENQKEKLAALKKRLTSLLPEKEKSLNKYFWEDIRKRIEQ